MNESKITSVQDYRKKCHEPKMVTLPSGATFKIRRLSPMDYIREGLADLPNEYFKFIGELMQGQTPEGNDETIKKNYEVFEQYLKITIEKGILDPPMTLRYEKDKQETHLIYAELSEEDKEYIVNVITGRISA